MCHLQFCLEVTDPVILQQLSISGDHPVSERFLFFPSLVTVKAPVGVWESSAEFTYQSAWVLQCRKPNQFFPSRFLHVVIHRMAFLFAMATSIISDELSLHRICNVWKDGISWISLDGVNVLVDFSNSSKLVILLRAQKGCELHTVKTRCKVISTVLKAKKDCCPKIDVNEFVAKNGFVAYPLKNDIELINILDIAKSVVSCQAFCYCNNNPNDIIKVATLLHFEPFSDLGTFILHELFTKGESELTDESLACISVRARSKADIFFMILDIFSPEFELNSATAGVTNKLLCALQLWRNKEHSYSSLCRRFSEYSVFAGRNPLVSR